MMHGQINIKLTNTVSKISWRPCGRRGM